MRWNDAADQYCSIARALGILGDRWTLLIIREAFSGVRRFDDFRRHLGIARNILTDRLQRLVAAKILELRPYQDNPPRQEYRLTERGRDLNAVLVSLLAWGDRWLADETGPPLLMRHEACGNTVAPELRCPACDGAMTAQNLRLVGGPGLPAEVNAEREHELQRLKEQHRRSLGEQPSASLLPGRAKRR